jgi:hypothetical protein
MGTAGINELLILATEAFEGHEEHSLMANLRSVTADDWTSKAPGGVRTIEQIVLHCGAAKYAYNNHAFEDGSLSFDAAVRLGAGRPMDELVDWMREGHRTWYCSIASMDDAELPRLRRLHWGEQAETRLIIGTMIQHDLYHAGEINHLRALRNADDAWPGDSAE